jgi:tetratricopeptide (TPR) repeat protein
MTVRSYKTEYILLLITVGIISLMLFLNDINQHIRIKEVRIYMQKSNREDNNIDHMNLVMKYQTQKRLYENQIRQDDADLIEMRANSILAENTGGKSVAMDRYRYLSVPSVFLINLFRSIINKGPIRDYTEDPVNIYLGVAYYYERNNSLAGALRIYARALKEEKYDKATIAGIILHQGYCNSIMGNYQVAKNTYLTVIREYEDDPAAVTALILLRYLEGFRTEIDRILEKDRDSVEKANKLFTLIAFRDAIDVLNRLEKNAAPGDRPKMSYIRGRCLEGLSEKEKAIDTYQAIVTNYAGSPYSILANRRIYLSGSMASNGARVKNLATANNRSIGDPVFIKLTDQEKKLRSAEEEDNNARYHRELVKEENLYPVLDLDKVESLADLEPTAPVAKKIVVTETLPAQKKEPPIIFRIETKEGNVFIGSIRMESAEQVIINTIAGDATIPKSKIASRKRIK